MSLFISRLKLSVWRIRYCTHLFGAYLPVIGKEASVLRKPQFIQEVRYCSVAIQFHASVTTAKDVCLHSRLFYLAVDRCYFLSTAVSDN